MYLLSRTLMQYNMHALSTYCTLSPFPGTGTILSKHCASHQDISLLSSLSRSLKLTFNKHLLHTKPCARNYKDKRGNMLSETPKSQFVISFIHAFVRPHVIIKHLLS